MRAVVLFLTMYYLVISWLFIEKLVLISGSQTTLNVTEGAACAYGKYNGTCVKYYRCLSTFEGVQTKELAPNCTFEGEDPVICCPDCELIHDFRKAVIFQYAGIKFWKGTRAHDKCLKYLSNLPYNCKDHQTGANGLQWHEEKKCKSKTWTLIAPVGGSNAKRYDYPHMALLGYGDNLASIEWLCAGSIISERFILTAAHCISSSIFGNVTYIAVGMLKRSDPPEFWHHYKVKRIIPYPEYKSPSRYHDIALLETEVQFNFSRAVLPACLDTTDDVYELPDYVLDATGWGDLGYGKPTADTLQTVMVEEFSDEECSKQYPPHRHMVYGFDNITQMCYGSHEDIKDTCQGDSGGPLQQKANARCQYDIRGVTSSGNRCGNKGGAGLYTRVAYYLPWIEDIVWPRDPSINAKLLELFKSTK